MAQAKFLYTISIRLYEIIHRNNSTVLKDILTMPLIISGINTKLQKKKSICYTGLVFTKGLRLSQVLKLRLLSQLSFVLKPYSQRVTAKSKIIK